MGAGPGTRAQTNSATQNSIFVVTEVRIYEFNPLIRRITDRSSRGAQLQSLVDEGTMDGGEWRPNQLQDSFNNVVKSICPVVSQSDMDTRAKAPTVESMHLASAAASSSAAAPIMVEDEDIAVAEPDEDDIESDIVGFNFFATPTPPPVAGSALPVAGTGVGAGKRHGGTPHPAPAEPKRRKGGRGGPAAPVAPVARWEVAALKLKNPPRPPQSHVGVAPAVAPLMPAPVAAAVPKTQRARELPLPPDVPAKRPNVQTPPVQVPKTLPVAPLSVPAKPAVKAPTMQLVAGSVGAVASAADAGTASGAAGAAEVGGQASGGSGGDARLAKVAAARAFLEAAKILDVPMREWRSKFMLLRALTSNDIPPEVVVKNFRMEARQYAEDGQAQKFVDLLRCDMAPLSTLAVGDRTQLWQKMVAFEAVRSSKSGAFPSAAFRALCAEASSNESSSCSGNYATILAAWHLLFAAGAPPSAMSSELCLAAWTVTPGRWPDGSDIHKLLTMCNKYQSGRLFGEHLRRSCKTPWHVAQDTTHKHSRAHYAHCTHSHNIQHAMRQTTKVTSGPKLRRRCSRRTRPAISWLRAKKRWRRGSWCAQSSPSTPWQALRLCAAH